MTPMQDPVAAATADDFVELVARKAGRHRDLDHVRVTADPAAPGPALDDYAAALRQLGLNVVARKGRLSSLDAADLPALIRDRSGRPRLAESRTQRGMLCRDDGVETPVVLPLNRRAVMLDVTTTDQDTTPRPTNVRAILGRQRRALAGVALTSAMVNLLGLSTPLIVLTVYDTAIPSRSFGLIWALIALAVLLVITEFALRTVRAWMIGDAGAQVERALGKALFRKLSRLPTQKLQSRSMYQQITRLKQFDAVRDALTGSFMLSLLDLPFSLLFLGTIALFSQSVALLLLGAAALFATLSVVFTKWQVRAGTAASLLKSDHDALLYEIARNRKAIQTFGMAASFEARAAAALAEADAAGRRHRMVQTSVQAFGQALIALVGLGAVAFATLETLAGALSFGGLILIVTLVWRVLGPMQALFSTGPRLVGLATSLRQIDAVLAQDEEMTQLAAIGRAKALHPPLAMRAVFLRFDAVHEPALANLSFTIEDGARVALCGPARSGKTCLLNTLAKLVVPGTGALTLGGIDYRQLTVDDIRRVVSYATHDNWFFGVTLRDNLKMGNPSLSDEQIWATLGKIGADRDLRRLHRGLDTIMTPKVVARLSTVQKKTFTIARTLCRDTPIYLFDDAMVGLAAIRAGQVWSALGAVGAHRTVIAVTDHLDQLVEADRIICLNEGRIVIDGAGAKDARAAAAIIQGRSA